MDQCTPQVSSPSHVVFLCRKMLIMPRSLWITPTEDLDHILHTSVTFLETFQWNGTKLDTNRHMLVCDNEVCIRFITESRCLGRKVKSYGGGACSSENLAKEIVVMTVLQGMYDLSAFKDILVWTLQCHSDLWAVRWPLNPTKSAGSSERREAWWGCLRLRNGGWRTSFISTPRALSSRSGWFQCFLPDVIYVLKWSQRQRGITGMLACYSHVPVHSFIDPARNCGDYSLCQLHAKFMLSCVPMDNQ